MKTTKTLALLLGLALAGCGGDDEGAGSGAEVRAEPAGGERDRGPVVDEGPAGPVAEDPTFELRASASGPYTAGTEGSFEIRLTPRGVYHVNEDFPMEIALSGPDGVTLPGEALGNDDAAALDESQARFAIPFTAAGAGEHTVTAEVDFAVCTPQACMPEHRTLALVLPVR